MPVLVDSVTRTVLVDTGTRKVLFQHPACSPPAGSCVHYIHFQVKLTDEDIANNYSDLFDFGIHADLTGGGTNIFVDPSGWYLTSPFTGDLNVSSDDVPVVAGQYYDVLAAWSDPGYTFTYLMITLCVNGVSTTVHIDKYSLATVGFQYLYVGDYFGGDAVVNRRYKEFVVSPGFDMSTDTFDSLVNATLLVEAGENVLLVDSGSDPGYGEKTTSPWPLLRCTVGTGACCFSSTLTCVVEGYQACIHGGGSYLGDGTTDCSPCGFPPPPGEGACCVPLCVVACDGGRFNCTYVTSLECAAEGGNYNGDGTPCDSICANEAGHCCGASDSCCGPTCNVIGLEVCCGNHPCPSEDSCCGDGTGGGFLCCGPETSCCGNGYNCCPPDTECQEDFSCL